MMVPSGTALVIASTLLEAYAGPSGSVAVLAVVGIVLIVAGIIREFAE